MERSTTQPDRGSSARRLSRAVALAAAAGVVALALGREFVVRGALPRAEVAATPPPAPGSSLAAAADDSLLTAYHAATAPRASDALTLELGPPRRLARLVVLQGVAAPARARVEVRGPDGRWRGAGPIARGYASLPLRGRPIAGVRLAWAPGSPPPRVHAVIPIAAPGA